MKKLIEIGNGRIIIKEALCASFNLQYKEKSSIIIKRGIDYEENNN